MSVLVFGSRSYWALYVWKTLKLCLFKAHWIKWSYQSRGWWQELPSIPQLLLSPSPTWTGPITCSSGPWASATSKFSTRTAPNKILNHTQTTKDRHHPTSRHGVYKIPCECSKVYVGETGWDLPTRLNEHKAHSHQGENDRSGIIWWHSHEKDHVIQRSSAKLIISIERWHPRRGRAAIEIFKHNTVPQEIHISDIWRQRLSNGSPIPTDNCTSSSNNSCLLGPSTHGTHSQTDTLQWTSSSHPSGHTSRKILHAPVAA